MDFRHSRRVFRCFGYFAVCFKFFRYSLDIGSSYNLRKGRIQTFTPQKHKQLLEFPENRMSATVCRAYLSAKIVFSFLLGHFLFGILLLKLPLEREGPIFFLFLPRLSNPGATPHARRRRKTRRPSSAGAFFSAMVPGASKTIRSSNT